MESNEFNFYSHLLIIIKELEEKDDYDDNVILKRLIYISSCELSSCFLDNVFVTSKIKFNNFENNKKYSKAMLDMLYQILRGFNAFQYKSVVNLFETLSLGNFATNDMVFFLKVLLTFYFTHEITLLSLEANFLINDYEVVFKDKYKEGVDKINGMLRTIPLLVLFEADDEEFISTIFRIQIDDNRRSNSTLPPVKQRNLNKSLNNSGFFTTSVTKVKHEPEISKNNSESIQSKANVNYKA